MNYTYQKPLIGKNIGVVFGTFAPLHQGHLDLIMRAKKENDGGAIVIVCGFDGDKGEPLMPLAKRYRYVREFFADDDLVAVYAISDTEMNFPKYPNGWKGWLKEFSRICEETLKIDISNTLFNWYVGDKQYENDLVDLNGQNLGFPINKAILVDRTATNPICATMIRNNPLANWDKITKPFRRLFSTNILICGTASEGKTTLTQDLGKYFNAPYSYECARDYLHEHCAADWELDSVDFIAFLNNQFEFNRKLIDSQANNGIVFADSDSMVTRMYAEYYSKDSSCKMTKEDFEKVAAAADAITAKCKWNKIFLVAPHGIFVDDTERYMAHSGMKERKELYEILCKNIKESGNWDKVTVLTGNYYENFMAIVNYVNKNKDGGENTWVNYSALKNRGLG